ncbi:MAG TPA: DUF1015 domain-containing protein [Bacteroidia bacterium]|nr:DUF1015 domain-containing protein [Bacteroidia bacterium]
MAIVIPFKGIRPSNDKVHLVASRAVDGYSKNELKEKLSGNPFSFLHVILPDVQDDKKTKPGSFERLQKVKNKFVHFIEEKIFIRDTSPCYYIYRRIKNEQEFTGIIGCSSIEDYFNGTIKKHEDTLTDRVQKLKNYLEVCDFNAEPVLFSYPNDSIIDNLTLQLTVSSPSYDFTTTDKIRHQLWVVNQTENIQLISNRFVKMPAIYIADGHHRSASSALLAKSRKEKNKNHTGIEPYNFYLGIFFPETQLKIYDFNRVVKDLNGIEKNIFLEKLLPHFSIINKGDKIYKASGLHNFSMYLEKEWYSLTLKNNFLTDVNPSENLDAYLLTKYILAPLLNIEDLRTNKRIGFVAGIKGMEELKNQVDSGKAKVAFGLYPVSMKQLKEIADANQIMPPKSTWIEPKMRNGLVVYSLSEK